MFKSSDSVEWKRFPGSLDSLREARAYVDKICRLVPLQDVNFSFQMQLAMNEVFCNIVKHGYKQRAVGEISISGRQVDKGIVLYILDDGQPFFFGTALKPDFEGLKDNGYGCFLINEMMDLVLYMNKNPYFPRNQHCLFKKFG